MTEPETEAPGDPNLSSRLIDRSPVHYGWVVLAAATVGLAMTIPGQTVGVSVVLDSIIDDLGLSRSQVSAAYTVGTLVGSLSLVFIGRNIDRHGPRRSVVAIVVAFALACAYMGLVGGLVTLAIGFTLIRAFGQGALSLVSIHALNMWFVRRRGFAVGMAGLGFAGATAVFPLGITFLVDRVDWRWTYVLLGLLVAAVMLPVGGGLFRQRPELYGLRPDSHRNPDPSEHDRAELNYGLADARKTLTFWLYVTGGFLTAALGTGLVFHHFSIMSENGLARSDAAVLFVAYGFVSAAASLITGFLVDHVPPRFLLGVGLAAMTLAMLGAPHVATVAAVVAYGAVLGTMQGMSQALQSTVYAHYFGRLHLGAIKGLATTVTVAGTAAGPLLLAVGFEAAGSYTPVLAISAILPAALSVISPFLPLARGGRIL